MKYAKYVVFGLAAILAIALAYSLVVISRQSRQLAGYKHQQAEDQMSIRQLRSVLQTQQLKEANTELSNQSSEKALRDALAQSQTALEASRSQVSSSKVRTSELEAQRVRRRDEYQQALANANEQLRNEKQIAQDQLAAFKQQMDAAHAEIQVSRLRVNALEALNAKLMKAKPAAPVQTQQAANSLRQIQALDERREAYAASVMDRYRQVSDQLQAMTGILEANRDANANVFSNEALSRIRDTLALANHDLRELDELNAQIRVLGKKSELK
ncbi:MAG: hypothetical protein KGM47_15285 [Acidobacteriota bacterium]|nr:hypothetical protein [Acidobacteriota bacterium]